MKHFFLTIIALQLGFASFAQHAFELTFGESGVFESIIQTIDHDGHYYALGHKVYPGSNERAMAFYRLDYSGAIINTVDFPKPDTAYHVKFCIPKPNGNLLCFGSLKHVDNPLRGRHTYVCEISPDLELVWEKMDSIEEVHLHASHWLKTFLLTHENEVIIQGAVDTVQYGQNNFIFLAKYDLEGNRLDYKSFINCKDSEYGSLMLNADSSGFYLFGELTVEPAYRTWIEFDFAFNYLDSGTLETNFGPAWAPVTGSWLSTGNFITANKFNVPGMNVKGLEMRLYSPGKQLLKSTVVYHDKTIRIPERKGMGFIDENNIWVATFEDIPPDFSGAENIRFFVFDNEINLKGSMTQEGEIRYWLWDLLATNDTACIVSGFVGENPDVTNYYDNYILKVRLNDVVTGINKQEKKAGTSVEIWPVPVGETLHLKSNIDSELLIMNAKGQQISTHPIKKGYNLITLTGLSSGIYLIAIRQNENIIETYKIIKQ
ncbi:MAG: hypothetical protein CVT92_15555 [Bacteroidetes bacterium HGW-Bacteroidetes-1]|jgi:hypothetical protein|nr:MAG: hypothetical protein CVT92_15555 [Bacteroidetes bacterium HGW-Bacteroidetes-1]